MLYSKPGIETSQCTLKSPFHYHGIGLHSGDQVTMTLIPACPDSGVQFLRSDVVRNDVSYNRGVIQASWRNIVDTDYCLVLGNEFGVTITSVELLLAALRICGVDNVLIEVSGEEIPAVAPNDMSLISLINEAGIENQEVPRMGIWIERSIEVRHCGQSALLNPSTRPAITAEVVMKGANTIDTRYVSAPLLDYVFEQRVFPTQGCGIDDQLYQLRETEEVDEEVIDPDENPQPGDNLTQSIPGHIILRGLGGMVLAETPVFGHLFMNSHRHHLTTALLREIFARPDTWTRRSYAEICQQCTYNGDVSYSQLH